MLLLEQVMISLEFEASANYYFAQKPYCIMWHENVSQSFDVQMPLSCLAPNAVHFLLSSKNLCTTHDGYVV